MILHILSHSPTGAGYIEECLSLLTAEDALLLINDGVYTASAQSPFAGHLQGCNCPLYALASDVKARGLENHLLNNIQLVDYEAWVELVAKYPRNMSWYP
ncbi:sulfurtransferase complex subunit TusB [Halioxenophilus sp. WMMB6]|uniref:sulfurtransferase complex subunit TusB n=1 Tax=Halioxenophilus sp. WMMB6 TaxID=3073815 RepID=UPI00295F1AD4|nr:sulfurtransferase complex subunit TusB [Halioxenophilus sp. WMMB6]